MAKWNPLLLLLLLPVTIILVSNKSVTLLSQISYPGPGSRLDLHDACNLQAVCGDDTACEWVFAARRMMVMIISFRRYRTSKYACVNREDDGRSLDGMLRVLAHRIEEHTMDAQEKAIPDGRSYHALLVLIPDEDKWQGTHCVRNFRPADKAPKLSIPPTRSSVSVAQWSDAVWCLTKAGWPRYTTLAPLVQERAIQHSELAAGLTTGMYVPTPASAKASFLDIAGKLACYNPVDNSRRRDGVKHLANQRCSCQVSLTAFCNWELVTVKSAHREVVLLLPATPVPQ
ncbi:uncharacterized protein B0H18DRAFT_1154805 [Fomitopsis serialis]|uniref:uncharacterized protein n=1 Tax=Fomitopsis serialis TaxID=139415 RepID=UPI0020084DEF|nr:uncharacterized protein B0H18DRAFT_1154805 [Neoantrodia serialis]KAH9929271.1 hypothetical protein B0H18DRAFT_1154805 [Neoantrodia serialis]